MWQEWEPDPESEDEGSGAVLLWCNGWVVSKDALVLALFRLGFADNLGAAWRLVDDIDLRHTYVCTEDAAGDERTLYECLPSENTDPRAVTFATLAPVERAT